MKKYLLIFLIASCDMEMTQTTDSEALQNQYEELEIISKSVKCKDASEWKITAVGSKACGGPASYLAYHKTIDTVAFLEKVNAYTKAEKKFNKKWGVFSDCIITPKPSKIICENGEPKFVMENNIF